MLKIDNIPQELKDLKQWVYYVCEPRIVRGKKKLTKIPYQINGKKASSTNPTQWNTYNAVANHYINIENSTPPEHGHGVGFVFDKGYVGIDLDNHIDETGKISDLARETIDLFCSYSEKSISGNGIHIIIKANNISLDKKRNDTIGIEVYNTERFFTMSGDVLDNIPCEVFDRSEELKTFINKYLPSSPKASPKQIVSTSLTVEEVLKRATSDEKFQLLYNGDTSAYMDDHSRADGALVMKLAYYCDGNPTLIDTIFRSSKLFRPKWDEKHGATTYGDYQIANALKITTEYFSSSSHSFDLSAKGKLLPTYNNCLVYFENQKLAIIKYNQFTNNVEYFGERLRDDHLLQIKEQMRLISLEPNINTIHEAVKTISLRNSYHPARDYIKSTKWDGVKRLDTWLIDYCGAEDSKYTRFVSKIIILAAVTRVFHPGCKYDYMPILEGQQGAKKSSAIAALGGEFYLSMSLHGQDRDIVQQMSGFMFVEIAELAAFAKKDIDTLKAFITRQVDVVRFAYARLTEPIPRSSTLIGTINPDEIGYLKDTTGNRRFFPVAVKNIDESSIRSVRDLLFAEAYQCYLNGDKLYTDNKDEVSEILEQQEMREVVDPWQEPIIRWILSPGMDNRSCVSATDIYLNPNVIGGKLTDSNLHYGVIRVGRILTKIGVERNVASRRDGVKGRYYDLTNVSMLKV